MSGGKIFISYSKKDAEFAERFAGDLMEAGYSVWWDRSITVGDEWEKSIEQQLKDSQEVVVILSPNAIASKWVQHEGSMAYALKKRIRPVLYEKISEDDLPIWSKKFQWHTFVDTDYQEALEKLKAILTPRNPIQDLLEDELNAYRHTDKEDLISETILPVILEARESLIISAEAEELIQKSLAQINHNKRIRWTGISLVVFLVAIALVTTTLAATGELNRFIFRPLPMEWSDTIPAGEFLMGSPNTDELADPDEFPQHTVYLDAYQMMVYGVTNVQYYQCVRAGICGTVGNQQYKDSELANYPVIDVSWTDANTFCEWAGGRLPSEAEWEKAARGGLESSLYPWGDEPPVCNLNVENGAHFFDCHHSQDINIVPVGTFMANGYGLYDMAGNVWVWVADWYNENYYAVSPDANPTGPQGGEARGLRGGSWRSGENLLRTANRNNAPPDFGYYYAGIRCARAVTP